MPASRYVCNKYQTFAFLMKLSEVRKWRLLYLSY